MMKETAEPYVVDYLATGANIKAYMDKKGISIRQMADELGISFQAVHGYVTGKRMPTLMHMYSICKMLDTTISDLIIVVPS